ncbi:MAG: stalk domain-containing protein [Caldisericia bacterium]|nr:stalk domain-containing protein [Caldisericia bacterium]MDD5688811.1 stalk domain-containing protein [Caldisericia bacterium]HOW02900.1 stalk domain-containing protein [Caldisericia bacterium]
MKKRFAALTSILVVIMLVTFVYAEQNIIIKLTVGNKNGTINDKPVTLDVPPVIQNGRTLVPLRFIGEAFGAKVDWDDKTRSITLTMPDIESLRSEIESLNSQVDSIKSSYENKIAELNKEIEDKNVLISQKEEEISKLKTECDEKVKALEEKINELESEITKLQEELTKTGTKEENPPVITLANLTDGQAITEKIVLTGKIEDENFITFVRVKFGSLVLFEGNDIGGEIDPTKFVSGEYPLSIEAIDSFGNKGEYKININIKNDEKKDPLKLSVAAMDTPISQTETTPYLSVQIINNGSSNLEILKIDAFDKQGNPFLIQGGMNLFDLLKMQMGFEHIWIHSKDKIMMPAAIDMQNSGKKAKELFKDWKVKVTFFDSIMEKELIREVIFKG